MNCQAGPLGCNLFSYCENNPVNKTDPTGHFGIGTILGAVVGGVIGGIMGAISAAYNGTSVSAGIITGATSGAIIGGVCGAVADAVSTGGVSLLLGAAIASVSSGVVAAGGNVANQYWNYKASTDTPSNPETGQSVLAKTPSSFAEYVNVKSIVRSGVTAAVFAPIGVGANCVLNSAFAGVANCGTTIAAQTISNFTMGGGVSILQGIVELF